MRLIDADALIKSIEDWYCKDCDNYNFVRCRACGTDDAISAIDSATVVNEWVSVEDRLPENETEVIIIVQHKIGWYRAFAWHDEYGWHSSAVEFGDGESDFVTHWMPLPEPPEEVNADGEV